MSDLAEFVLARIAEDEEWIKGDGGSYLDECQECAFGQQPQSPYSKARVLAECEAKRRILETHRPYRRIYGLGCDVCLHPRRLTVDVDGWPCPTLRLLALPYADHPDYRQEWKP